MDAAGSALPPPYRPIQNDISTLMQQLQASVTVGQCMAHLRLLHHFSKLHEAYASLSELDHFAFLCAAERRYTDWMRGLATAIGRDRHTAFIVSPPIPPLDVALFWAAHMLSPIRYLDDMHCVFPDVWQMHHVQFPIQALAAHADDGLVNAESEAFWSEYVSATEPYSLLGEPGSSNDIVQTFSVPFTCPYCKHTCSVPDASVYVRFRLNGQSLRCPQCLGTASVMQTSTARLLDAIVAFRADPTTFRLPACHYDSDTCLFDAKANRNHLTVMFVTNAKEWDELLSTYLSLGAQPPAVQRASLNMDALLKLSLPVLGTVAQTHRRVAKVPYSPDRKLFTRLIPAYQNIPVGPWSMDLVQAVLRQWDFIGKMAHGAVQANLEHFALRAHERYRKFLLLLHDHPRMFFVPTLDIDLGWHTHQLLGSKYTEFTQRLTGSVVNHDDTVAKTKLRSGVHETGVLWLKKFGEPYACDEKYQKFWTADRVGPTLLLAPVYGPVQLYHSARHKQAINGEGACAVNSPTLDPVEHKRAFSEFASQKSAKKRARAQAVTTGDPTKSSRLPKNTPPMPYYYFFSGCAQNGGLCGFSERSVEEATAGPVGGEHNGTRSRSSRGRNGASRCGTSVL